MSLSRIRPIQRSQANYDDATIRDFSGGWNVVDNDLNLSTKYASVLRNMYRASDGSISIRQGTRLFCDLQTKASNLINIEYFNKFLITVDDLGQVFAIDARGRSYTIFDEVIAADLPGAPDGWNFTDGVAFTQFKGRLVVANGINKPLVVNQEMQCDYLQDEGTLSNINVPISRIIKAHNRYLVMAVGSTIHVGSKDTIGTFVGDPAPNDAVDVDLSGYVPNGSTEIIGLGSYRDRLIVTFAECSLVVQLGVYSGSDHEPFVEDVIEQNGTVSHRSIQSLGEDMLYCDIGGVPSISRALFTGAIQPDRVSALIDPEIQASLSKLTKAVSLEDGIFSVYGRTETQYMLFIPDTDAIEDRRETRGFVYVYNKPLKQKTWHEIRGWKWAGGCRSEQGRIFFIRDNQIFVMGNDQDPIHGDYQGWMEDFSDGTKFEDNTGFYPVADSKNSIPIDFVFEIPWFDYDKRTHIKHNHFLQLDTFGDAEFSVQMFVDNIYEDKNDFGEAFQDDTMFSDDTGFVRREPALLPALEMDFVGGDHPGFGNAGFGSDLFGGGRPSNDERLYKWPAKFKIAKYRIYGSTNRPLSLVSISGIYSKGSIRRA